MDDALARIQELMMGRVLQANQPQPPSWQPQGDPWAGGQGIVQQNLQPGQPMMPPVPPPPMQQMQQPMQNGQPNIPAVQGGGLVDQITQFMMHPLTQGAMGALGGALSGGRGGRVNAGQRIGNAFLGGMGGAEAATRTQIYQQQQEAQVAHQQELQKQARAREERELREEAIKTRLLNAIPEEERPYAVYPGARPKVDMSVTEGDLAFKAVNDPTPEGRTRARDALQLLQGIKSKERAITKDRLAWEAENAGTPEERQQAAAALKRLQEMEMEIERNREAGRDRRVGRRNREGDEREDKRDKRDTQTQLLSQKRIYLSQRTTEEKEEPLDEGKFRQWLKADSPALYEDAIKYRLIPPSTAAPQGGGGGPPAGARVRDYTQLGAPAAPAAPAPGPGLTPSFPVTPGGPMTPTSQTVITSRIDLG